MTRHHAQRRLTGAAPHSPGAGFTMVELVTVIVVMGILGAIGASRFFDGDTFSGRAYSDQAKSIIRSAQKLAIAQNRLVFVRFTPTNFAVCFNAGCDSAAALAFAPGGSNSGSAATRAACVLGGNYIAGWMCEGTPANVTVTGVGSGGLFFDRMGRPYNTDDEDGASTFLQPLTLTFTSGTGGTSVYQFIIEAETGYVR